ncbi:IS4 family transposase, partial [Acaryochloris marina NIES-2412]
RMAKLAVRCCLVELQRPARLASSQPLQVYAVYATEVAPPEDEEPVSWMLLTSEVVTTVEMAQTILRWYT